MSQLFSPYSIADLQLKNRIVIAPMCQYSAENGNATDWHLIHLAHLALSGAALLIIEATAVEAEGRITPGDLGLWSDDNETALKRVLAAVRRHSSMPIAIQLAHAGRKASSHVPWDGGQLILPAQGGWRPVAPSAIAHAPHEPAPVALDNAGLQRVVQAFVATAQRASRLGIDAIELHAAHGYLLHQFLSPLANTRDDEYGGTLENRMRFPLAVFDAVRAAVPAAMPVGLRLSATDWVEGGWNVEQSVTFGQVLRQRGCAFVHVSSGGVSPLQQIPLGPGSGRAGRGDHRRGACRSGGAGARHVVRPALAVARRSHPGCRSRSAAAILALAATCCEPLVWRRQNGSALSARGEWRMVNARRPCCGGEGRCLVGRAACRGFPVPRGQRKGPSY